MTLDEFLAELATVAKGRAFAIITGGMVRDQSGNCPICAVFCPAGASGGENWHATEIAESHGMDYWEACKVVDAADDEDAFLRRRLLVACGLSPSPAEEGNGVGG